MSHQWPVSRKYVLAVSFRRQSPAITAAEAGAAETNGLRIEYFYVLCEFDFHVKGFWERNTHRTADKIAYVGTPLVACFWTPYVTF